MNLEQLLGTLEHAGRDARRQQDLSEMIDRMAGEESGGHRHGVWWWMGRVVAAACVLFFVVTAVRIWFIPTGERTVPLVAEVEVSAPYQRRTNAVPTPYQYRTNTYHGGSRTVVERPQQGAFTEDVAETIAIEDVYVENELVEEIADSVENPLVISDEIADEPEVYQEIIEPEEQVLPIQPEPEPVATKPQDRKRSLFSGLLRRAEPSKMDGTMLAINIL